MAIYESLGAESLQDQNKLRALSETTHAWLELNSKNLELGIITEIVDHHAGDGLPMVRGGDLPRLQFELSGEAIWAITPMAADILSLDGSMKLSSLIPHYKEQPDESWVQAEVNDREFAFNKKIGELVVRETLVVKQSDGIDEKGSLVTVFSGDRMTEFADRDVMDSLQFYEGDMSVLECWALKTIVDNASDIRYYQPEPVEPIEPIEPVSA